MRIKVTGYFEPEPDQIDENDATGLTEEAHLDLIVDENGTGLKVADLEDVELEVEH